MRSGEGGLWCAFVGESSISVPLLSQAALCLGSMGCWEFVGVLLLRPICAACRVWGCAYRIVWLLVDMKQPVVGLGVHRWPD